MHHLIRIMAILALAAPGFSQTVTAVTEVRIDGRVQRVRKINGRWWSDDNRQLTPSKGGFIWWISSQKGKSWPFHHHRPVDLGLAESLHLFMSPSSVESLLGEPNEGTEPDARGSAMWMYYAENGTALFVRFMNNELGEATYQRSDFGVSGKPVQSIAQELAGRDIFKVMADRAWQRSSPEAYAKYHGQDQAGRTSVVSVRAASTRPDPPKRRISVELAQSVKVGMARAEVVRIAGEPSGGMQISGGASDFEDLTYPLDPAGQITFHLEKGRVARISR